MEIERKFLIAECPADYTKYECRLIEQGYLCTEPVLRIRRSNEKYIFTYKSAGLVCREEIEKPLTEEAYNHLLKKCDGEIIRKKRYKIPDNRPDSERFRDGFTPNESPRLTIELDVFEGGLTGLVLSEVEFPDEETAKNYIAPSWFTVEVSETNSFHNSTISRTPAETILETAKKTLGQ